MNCDRVQNWLLLAMDEEMKPQQCRLIDKHLAKCSACRKAAEEFVSVQRMMDKALYTEVNAPTSLGYRVVDAIKKQPDLRFRWVRLLPRLKVRQHLVPALLALCLLLSGYSLGYWHADHQRTWILSDRQLVPKLLPDTDQVVRTRRHKIPNMHPFPLWRYRLKKV